ncbi:MAG TPA: amino acid permease [Planctomycetota bacterium]|nr:amino acid permease [Planctomycetota bacterium]
MDQERDLPRKIGFWGGSAIMVGIIVGSGIFAVPRTIAGELDSPLGILGLWVAGGVLSLFGALTYAELGAMFPRSGGIYVYLREGLGGTVAFVFGWTYMILTKPLAAAGIVTIFSEHLNPLLGVSWRPEIVTCVLLTLLTVINLVGVRLGTGVSVALTAFKVAALLGIVGCGVFLGRGSPAAFRAPPSGRGYLDALAPVLYSILWTYDGWSDVAAVAGEVEEPQKNLPRIFLVGTAATILLYVAVNAVYLSVLPVPEMRQTAAVAPEVMRRLVGPWGATAVGALIVLSTLGSSHASVLTGARVTFAQAREGLLFRPLGRIHPRFETPGVSLGVQLVLSCAAVLVYRNFDTLAGGFTFTMWIFYALSALAVIVLRIRRPDLPRPYRCWGYPLVPAVFILAAAGMTVLELRGAPWRHTVPWLGVFVAGVPAYWLWRRGTSLRA